MLKKVLPLFIGLGLLFSIAYAGENYTISGEGTFQYDGDIYICLYDKEGWRDFQTPGHELFSPQCKVIKMNADLKKAGKVSFTFDSVPKGTYCIVALQDVNGNGKVDFANYQISEPWGSYKDVSTTGPSWGSIKFDLVEGITGLKIQM
jgi:uncharacterized protein (DUF2141 family)